MDEQMSKTLEEEFEKWWNDPEGADAADKGLAGSAWYAGIEAWKRQQPKAPDHFVYQMCPRHIAYPWPSFTTKATYVPPPRAVCPICEPPMSASLHTSETTAALPPPATT